MTEGGEGHKPLEEQSGPKSADNLTFAQALQKLEAAEAAHPGKEDAGSVPKARMNQLEKELRDSQALKKLEKSIDDLRQSLDGKNDLEKRVMLQKLDKEAEQGLEKDIPVDEKYRGLPMYIWKREIGRMMPSVVIDAHSVAEPAARPVIPESPPQQPVSPEPAPNPNGINTEDPLEDLEETIRISLPEILTSQYLVQLLKESTPRIARAKISQERREPVFERIRAKIKELEQKEKEAREQEAQRNRQVEPTRQTRNRNSRSFDEEGDLGYSSLPDIRKDGEKKLRDEVESRLREIITVQKNQPFVENRSFTVPWGITLQTLHPRDGETDEFTTPGGEHFRFSTVRKELQEMENAYRNIQNFIYAFQRVDGATGTIGISNLLSKDTIGYLIRMPEVAEAMRKFEEIGKDVHDLKQKKHKEGLTEVEISRLDELENNAKIMMAEEKINGSVAQGTGGEIPFWAYRIAGGLYSGLGEAARQNMGINENGDFFINRLYSFPAEVKKNWETNWNRKSRPSLYNALDLRLSTFWENTVRATIEKKPEGEARETEKVRLEGLGIRFTPEGRLDMSGAKFELITFSDRTSQGYLEIQQTEASVPYKDISDAEGVRSTLLSSEGPLVNFGPNKLFNIVNTMKHLKGTVRQDWIAGMLEETMDYFGGHGGLSISIPAREIPMYKGTETWTWEVAENYINRFSNVLGKENYRKIMREYVGSPTKIFIKRYGGEVGRMGWTFTKTFVKGLFDLLGGALGGK